MAIIVLIHPISSYYSQKYQTICRKNTKRNATKTPNEMRNSQEISGLCLCLMLGGILNINHYKPLIVF